MTYGISSTALYYDCTVYQLIYGPIPRSVPTYELICVPKKLAQKVSKGGRVCPKQLLRKAR
eukprot:489105-Rhodomonas_salina.1